MSKGVLFGNSKVVILKGDSSKKIKTVTIRQENTARLKNTAARLKERAVSKGFLFGNYKVAIFKGDSSKNNKSVTIPQKNTASLSFEPPGSKSFEIISQIGKYLPDFPKYLIDFPSWGIAVFRGDSSKLRRDFS